MTSAQNETLRKQRWRLLSHGWTKKNHDRLSYALHLPHHSKRPLPRAQNCKPRRRSGMLMLSMSGHSLLT